MPTPPPSSAVQENIYFLLNEVEKHCHFVELFFKTHSVELLPRIRARRGYVQTLREKIERECALMIKRRKPGTAFYNQVTATRALANALQGISSHCIECVQEGTLDEPYQHPVNDLCRKLIRRIDRSINLVKLGMNTSQRRTGIKLARRTRRLLDIYDDIQSRTLSAKQSLTDDQLRAAVLCNYGLKRLIKQLALVGEALIKADLGQVATLQNFDHLRDTASSLNYDLNDLKVRRLALTRSGSAIAAISHKNENGKDILAVYKEGDHTKIEEEIQGVKQWRKVDPRLAPNVLAQAKADGENSALLIEHIQGSTFEALLLEERKSGVKAALKALFKTLNSSWKETYTPEQSYAKFMQQLEKRVEDSKKVHPDFFAPEQHICGLRRLAFDDLTQIVAKKESTWRAPFSVLIHGDFNVDNLIYDDSEDRIYFIDLHRSDYFDYVQDISVLMVSIYRLQVLSGSTRKLMMESAKEIYQFGKRFAKRHNDTTFELRLAAGLARSFATSTRFIFDKKLSSKMHLRSRYLLEKLAALPQENESKFKIPLKELYIE
ncbi:phosphotransferase [Marinomonas balearica]|uniref:Phosphotransferase family enzyme n=1 Tax=Marinomonas balearica TaxID=491947 RepID=A0A4R6MBH0_9GAMM|nr:phosphotransferase [Marinomonas balearica]TDO98948.1 phosphotransferase family enzyme [Marinomonas balearica]